MCKSLGLEDEFIKRATNIRLKYNPDSAGVLSQNTSRYNSKKIRTICEICNKKQGVDTHHLEFQRKADKKNGYIKDFNKNHPANLASVCDDCHKIIHMENIEMRKTKTTKGTRLTRVN